MGAPGFAGPARTEEHTKMLVLVVNGIAMASEFANVYLRTTLVIHEACRDHPKSF